MKTRFHFCTAVLVFALLLVSPLSIWGQTFRGSIQGTVTDASGAAIAGAKVKVFSPGTGLSRSLTTNDQGAYVASELPLGSYNITVEMKGFRTTTLNGISVSVGAPSRADARLSAGAIEEVVQVNADVPLVETSNNTSGGTIEASQAAELPINGHDYTKLLELVPGASSDPNGSTESAGSYGLFSLNGNRGRSNNYLLDGTDMNDGYRNLPSVNQAGVWGCPSTILPVDALAELPVTGNPEAEFGRSSGATVNIVTKSGTNAIHGSFFESFRDDSLSARNYFNTAPSPKNSFTNHQFGGAVGGPVIADKTFYYVAYEGQREDGALPQLGLVPTQTEISNFGTGNINPVIAKLLASNPWGPLPTSSENVTFSTPFNNVSDNAIVKADQHAKLFSPEDLITGRYFYSHGMQSFPLGMLNSGLSSPKYNTLTPTHVNIVSLSYTSVPRSNLIVEVRGGFNRFIQQFLPEDGNLDPNQAYGLNTLPPGNNAHDLGLPFIKIYGDNGTYSTIGSGATDARGRVDTNYQLFSNVSYTRGHHAYKAGVEWRRTFINSFINSGHRGTLTFNTLDDFLGGIIDSGSSAEGYGTRYSYQNGSGMYFTDSWRPNARVTVNYGLRWDYYGVIGAKNGAFSIFNAKTASLQTIGASGAPSSLYPKVWDDFAPRFSIADDLLGNGKLVVRTGAGIYYDGPSQDFFVGNFAYNTVAADEGPAFNTIGLGTPLYNYNGGTQELITSGATIFGNYSPNSVFSVDQGNTTPRYVSYTLNLESQLAKKIALQVGYVGSQGRHLFRLRDLNQVNNVNGRTVSCGNGQTASYGSSCFSTYTSGSNSYGLVYLDQIETTAHSNYNSAQVTLKLQDLHGLTSTLNYTWAHSIDTASDGLDFVPNAAQPDDSFNPGAEYASSNFDVRQRVQWFWTYNAPKFKTAGWISNGWAIDGMYNFASGQPYTVSYLFENDYNGSGEWFGRPDIISDPHQGVSGRGNLLNMAAFAAPCTVDNSGNCSSGHPGSEGRNAFTSPSFTNFDFSLTKTNHLTERLKMELRVDIFNLFNHPNMTNPLMPGFGLDIFGASHQVGNRLLAGTDPATTGTQYVQSTATPDVGSGNPYLGGGGPRGAQLAAHFTF
jgi:hypothetical protein